MANKTLDKITIAVLPPLVYLLLKCLTATMRFSYVNDQKYRAMVDGHENMIVAFWHGRLLMMPLGYRSKDFTILVSHHKDGELISRLANLLGVTTVRGSTSKGALGGLKGLLKAAKRGHTLGITPDGPRGPGRVAQMGAVQIAARTGLPIIPASFNASRVKTFKSWDAFLLPYPFSRGVYVLGDPIRVSHGAGPEELEEKRALLETTLNALTDRADAYFSGK